MATFPGTHALREDLPYYEALGGQYSAKVTLLYEHFKALAARVKCITVLDIGCGEGSVLRKLREVLVQEGIQEGTYTLLGLDGSAQAVEVATMLGGAKFACADLCKQEWQRTAMELIQAETSLKQADLIFVSSVLHELPKLGQEETSLVDFFVAARGLLAENGRLIIREPVKPDCNEAFLLGLPTKVKVSEALGLKKCSQRFQDASYAEIFKSFETEFFANVTEFPFREQFASRPVFSKGEDTVFVQVSSFMLSEFLRKRTFIDSEENWNSEMMEINGRFTVIDLQRYAKKSGFGHVSFALHHENGFYGELRDAEHIRIYSPKAPQMLKEHEVINPDFIDDASVVMSADEIRSRFPSHMHGYLEIVPTMSTEMSSPRKCRASKRRCVGN